jgi:hypothetical protein
MPAFATSDQLPEEKAPTSMEPQVNPDVNGFKSDDDNRAAADGDGGNGEVDYSASFLEDEFLNDAISDGGNELGVSGIQPPSSTPMPTPTTPVVKKRGPGRPRKSIVASQLTPVSEPTTADLSNSIFATPTDVPRKRGRKKKVVAEVDPEDTPLAGPDSSPGKRSRKRVNYLELSGDIEPSESADTDDVSATESPISETPKVSKRGRKKKVITDDSMLSDTDAASTPTIAKTPPGIFCGKCDSTFKARQGFLIHAASAHGGVVSSLELLKTATRYMITHTKLS